MQSQSPAASCGAVRYKTDSTSIGNDQDPAMKKSHDDAAYAQDQKEPFSEGHSLDRKDQSRTFQDKHTKELDNAQKHRAAGSQAGIGADAASGGTESSQDAREAHRTPSMKKFQPGQSGEQIGGAGSPKDGRQPGEGMSGTEKAPATKTGSGVKDFVKNLGGGGPTNGFHTYARSRMPARAVPDEAVEKGARKPKDTGVGAEQSPHLPHHPPGEGDKMPAVKNNAGLPSKGGKTPSGSGQQKSSFHTYAARYSTIRPTGTANTPGSQAVDPNAGVNSPSDGSGPSAAYTHVKGNPEPDSHQKGYEFASAGSGGGMPSGTAPRSSTSAAAYPDHGAMKGIKKDEAGVGSSTKMHQDPLKPADEMVDLQRPEVGQAGDDAGGRAYTPPPDVGSNIEDTLPKPIKK